MDGIVDSLGNFGQRILTWTGKPATNGLLLFFFIYFGTFAIALGLAIDRIERLVSQGGRPVAGATMSRGASTIIAAILCAASVGFLLVAFLAASRN